MRLRKNRELPPHLREQALERAQELVATAQKLGRDVVWVNAQMYGEYDANCQHVVQECLRESKITLSC